MPNRARNKIAALIVAGYGLVLLLVVALGLLAVAAMDDLASISRSLYEHPFKASNAALEAKISAVQARNRMFRILLFDDPGRVREWSEQIAALDRKTQEQWSLVRESFLGDIDRVDKAAALLGQGRELRRRVVELAAQGRRADAAALLREGGLDLFAKANEDMDYVIGFARNKALAFVDESESRAETDVKQVAGLLAGLALAIDFIGWLVVRQVMAMVRRVEQMERDYLESRHQAESAAYVRSLIEASLDPLVTISAEGKITDANRAAELATGLARGELVGTDFADYFTEPGKAHAGYKKAFSEGAVVDYPLAIRHRGGRVAEVLYNASLYRDEAGNALGVFAAARDVTERNRLAREREQYFRFFMLSVDAMCIADPFGCFKHVNPAMARLTGYAAEELVSRPFLDFVLPEDREKTREEMRRQTEGRPTYHFENRYRRKDGGVVLLSWTAYCDKEDGITYATAHDHTALHAAEEALREKEERLALATLQNGVGVWDWNLLTQEMIWDDSMYALYRIRREDFAGTEQAWRAALHPDDLAREDKEVEDAIAGGKPFDTEFRAVWPGGEIRHIKAVAKVFRDEGGRPVRMLGINMDVTERKQAEARLAASEARLRAIVETEPECIKVVDAGGRLRQMNPAGLAMIEADSFEQVAGQPVLGLIAPAYQQAYAQLHERVIAGQPQKMEYVMIGLKGRPLWLETHAVPMLDGAEVAHLAITRDITDRKQAEEKIRQMNAELEERVAARTAELEAANKELEAFSYSVSHDLRTPLRAIDGFSLILLEDYAGALDEEGRRLLGVVRANTCRMSRLIDDILRFSRAGRTEMSFAKIDMDRLAREVLEELEPGRNVQIELGALPAATGDRAMLRQVLANLLSNAVKFSGKGAAPRVEIGGRLEGGGMAVYWVKDNGVGFDMRYAAKLFGVFQRLHGVEEFDGTGIGLAIVKRVVARHGGTVWAEGEVGKGAAFYFSIPVGNGAVLEETQFKKYLSIPVGGQG